MATAQYHRRQAEVLVRLALSTSDSETAAALRRLAAEHAATADAAEGRPAAEGHKPDQDR
jgi:hypothetical protein